MPKTVEEIKAEVTALVKSQGNQGAISLGTVLDDITELAGEGGGGGTVLPTIYLKNPAGAGDTITVDTTEDTKAIYDAAVANGNVVFNVSFKNDELGGSASELVTAVSPIARASILNGRVVSTIIITGGTSPTQITSMVLFLSFAANGAISVTNTTNTYTIPE
jgi:hypothetical protein